MGDLRLHVRGPEPPDAPVALHREVRPPQRTERRPASTLGLLAAALVMAVGIDTALWHQNFERRSAENRARAAELHAASLERQLDALRNELVQSHQHARSLYDELTRRGRGDDAARAMGARAFSTEVEVSP
jgi:uncharacterized protein HemX